MTPVQDLEGAKALVTGGGTGVGLGITRCLLRHGARVATAAELEPMGIRMCARDS